MDFPGKNCEEETKAEGGRRKIGSIPPSSFVMDPSTSVPRPTSSSSSSSSQHVERMINSNHYKSPSRTICSDRFIPCRSASKFFLFDIPPADTSTPYASLLRTALFGPDAPVTPEKTSPNILRYKTETRQSMHSLSPFMLDHDVVSGVNHTPVKPPRKVPRSPYKVNFFSFLFFFGEGVFLFE